MATTQYAQASYQEVIDLHTEADTVSIVGLHTPIGDAPYNMLKGFFDQFRKFAYGGMRFSLVPVARLPADPLQVSYEAGDASAYLDPRDLMNPIMFKGCHGNDMGTILNTMYSGSLDRDGVFSGYQYQNSPSMDDISSPAPENQTVTNPLTDLYYSALTDNTWLKAHPQAGMRKAGLRPLVYSVGSMVPLGIADTGKFGQVSDGDAYGEAQGGFMGQNPANPASGGTSNPILGGVMPVTPAINNTSGTLIGLASYGTMPPLITPRLQRLGWMDTHTYLKADDAGANQTQTGLENFNSLQNGLYNEFDVAVARLPKIFMGMMMLPPAYSHEQYFRLIIDHQFKFKDFRGISTGDINDKINHQYYNFN